MHHRHFRTLDLWHNAARLPVRHGHKAISTGASPSPAKIVGGKRPLPRPHLTSPLTKAVPCLLSRDFCLLGLLQVSYSSIQVFKNIVKEKPTKIKKCMSDYLSMICQDFREDLCHKFVKKFFLEDFPKLSE